LSERFALTQSICFCVDLDRSAAGAHSSLTGFYTLVVAT
jgi:hypothetical protein